MLKTVILLNTTQGKCIHICRKIPFRGVEQKHSRIGKIEEENEMK